MGLWGHGRFLRQSEFESEERVGSAIFEVDNIAVHVAGESDRADDAEHAEIVLGNRANDTDPVTLNRRNLPYSISLPRPDVPLFALPPVPSAKWFSNAAKTLLHSSQSFRCSLSLSLNSTRPSTAPKSFKGSMCLVPCRIKSP